MAMSKRRRTNKEADQVNYLPTKGLLQEGSKIVLSLNPLELGTFFLFFFFFLFFLFFIFLIYLFIYLFILVR